MTPKKALEKCMYSCSKREYCEYDIREKLRKWEIPYSEQQKIIDRLFEEKFLNHERYISAYINDKFRFNHWGKIKIRYHLKQKRLDSKMIDDLLKEIDNEIYKNILKEEINKKLNRTKGNNDFEVKQKVARYVISKGFEPDIVFELL